MSREPQTWSDGESRSWIGCHVHYHDDQDLLLRDLLAPYARDLLAGAVIDRFFFVRYALGGPHVRLRFRLAPGADAEGVLSEAEAQARRFFGRHPSRRTWTEEQTRRRNGVLLANDPAEHDASVYPDESFRVVPFVPETERYGGPDLLPASLELFTLSSLAALDVLEGCGSTRSRRLNAFFRHLGRQTWGAVAGAEELEDLFERLSRPHGDAFVRPLAQAERSFAERPELFTRLLTRAVDGEPDVARLAEGAAFLRRRLGGLDEPKRRSILSSHLHMSANRLGLSNAEEAYLYRLLSLAAGALRRTRGDLWSRLEAGRACASRMAGADGELAALVDSALEGFAGDPAAVPRRRYH